MPIILIGLGIIGIGVTGLAIHATGNAVQQTTSGVTQVAIICGGVYIAGKLARAW